MGLKAPESKAQGFSLGMRFRVREARPEGNARLVDASPPYHQYTVGEFTRKGESWG